MFGIHFMNCVVSTFMVFVRRLNLQFRLTAQFMRGAFVTK
jgi:hypothetical protein